MIPPVNTELNNGISRDSDRNANVNFDDSFGMVTRSLVGAHGNDSERCGAIRAPQHRVVPRRRGLWCEKCNSLVVELKRQAVKVWMPFATQRGKIRYTVSPLKLFLHSNKRSNFFFSADHL